MDILSSISLSLFNTCLSCTKRENSPHIFLFFSRSLFSTSFVRYLFVIIIDLQLSKKKRQPKRRQRNKKNVPIRCVLMPTTECLVSVLTFYEKEKHQSSSQLLSLVLCPVQCVTFNFFFFKLYKKRKTEKLINFNRSYSNKMKCHFTSVANGEERIGARKKKEFRHSLFFSLIRRKKQLGNNNND